MGTQVKFAKNIWTIEYECNNWFFLYYLHILSKLHSNEMFHFEGMYESIGIIFFWQLQKKLLLHVFLKIMKQSHDYADIYLRMLCL